MILRTCVNGLRQAWALVIVVAAEHAAWCRKEAATALHRLLPLEGAARLHIVLLLHAPISDSGQQLLTTAVWHVLLSTRWRMLYVSARSRAAAVHQIQTHCC
jgi:hypothetical protein